jgi:hypothetical protein
MGIYHGNPWDISWVGNNEDIPGIYLGYTWDIYVMEMGRS